MIDSIKPTPILPAQPTSTQQGYKVESSEAAKDQAHSKQQQKKRIDRRSGGDRRQQQNKKDPKFDMRHSAGRRKSDRRFPSVSIDA